MSNLYKEVRRERSPVRFPVPRDSRSFNGVQNYTDFMRELHSRGAPPLTAMPYPPPVSNSLCTIIWITPYSSSYVPSLFLSHIDHQFEYLHNLKIIHSASGRIFSAFECEGMFLFKFAYQES